MYTDGKHLRRLAAQVGAKDGPVKAHWQFAPDAPLEARPQGGTIVVTYPQNTITYSYDRATNTYLRSVTGEPKQIDKADGKRVAPKNVVIMNMIFGPLNDGHPNKHRLEANVVGSGKAWIATNGKTIKGTWSKKSNTAPTLFFDSAGKPVTLTVGQTFVQVMRVGRGYSVSIKDGKVPAASPSPSGSAPQRLVLTAGPGLGPASPGLSRAGARPRRRRPASRRPPRPTSVARSSRAASPRPRGARGRGRRPRSRAGPWPAGPGRAPRRGARRPRRSRAGSRRPTRRPASRRRSPR